jgi:hypothetical protein
VIKAKGKEIAHQDNYGISPITYRRQIHSRQMVQTRVTTETVVETVEQAKKTPMTMLEVVPEPETTDTGSGMLGNRVVRLVKIMEKNGAESECNDGVTGGLRKAREESILHETHDSLRTSPGVEEIQKLEEQIHDGGETGVVGKHQLGSVLSVGIGKDRDEGDQEGKSPRKTEMDVGLGEIEAPSKGLKVQEIIGEVAALGCENEVWEEGEEDNILALVTRTDEVIGGSEMLDI